MSGVRAERDVATVALRPAAEGDCLAIWMWRNDPVTRAASFDSEPIPYESHERWFRASLERPDRKMYVITVAGDPAGVARLDVDGDEAVVSIHLAPERRGRGIGPAALDVLADTAFRHLALVRLTAVVKRDNRPSLAAFARAGFTLVDQGGAITLARHRSPR